MKGHAAGSHRLYPHGYFAHAGLHGPCHGLHAFPDVLRNCCSPAWSVLWYLHICGTPAKMAVEGVKHFKALYLTVGGRESTGGLACSWRQSSFGSTTQCKPTPFT